MEMEIRLAGKKRVEAVMGGMVIATDQPVKDGGEGSAPSPFMLFLASMGTCSAFYMLDFCQHRNISTDGMTIHQKMDKDPTGHLINRIRIEVTLPKDFPAQYRNAILSAARLCAVKKHLETPPQIEVEIVA